MNLPKALWTHFAIAGRGEFIVTPDTRVSYGNAASGIASWQAKFDQSDLSEGDRVVIRTERDDVASVLFLAALLDGVVPVLLEGGTPERRLAGIVSAVEPKLVISDQHSAELPSDVEQLVLHKRHKPPSVLRFLKRQNEVELGVETTPPSREPRLPAHDGLAYIQFTSGTTSAPTGVEISRKNLFSNLDTISRLFEYDSSSRILNDMTISHADGLVQGPLLAAYNGACLVRAGGFQTDRIEDWLAVVRAERCTDVITVPTVWAMIDRYAAYDDYFDGDECRSLQSVASKLHPDLWDRLQKRFNRPLTNHYGLSETVTSALYAGDISEAGAPFSVGKPVDCSARIPNDAQEGELQIKGDNVFSAYWRNPERTAESFTEDGWFRTGDIAKRLPDGSFDIVGRIKTAIVSGGVLIRPEEIDAALSNHPGIVESATVGIPDDIFGEIAVSAIVLSDEVTDAELDYHLRQFVEPRKVPKHLVRRSAIPRGPSGKPLTANLRDVLATQLSNASDRSTEDQDIARRVLKIAAKVFRVGEEDVSLHSRPDDIAGWDSFTQINLILNLEKEFACDIPVRTVSQIHSLNDAVAAVTASTR